MGEFEKAYAGLNKKQLEAVNQIDGPVLVIAGPGTGKTQLLSTRIGHILKKTDTLPSSILCLTYTEAAASEMRERLIALIGEEAYSINISTYHAYGAEIMRRNPEYFDDANLELVEDLRAYLILNDIIARLPYSNPLKFADNYIKDIQSFISDCKRALLTPENIEAIANANLSFIEKANKLLPAEIVDMARITKKIVGSFKSLLEQLKKIKSEGPLPPTILPLGSYAAAQLEAALEDFETTQKTTSLSQWKRDWLAKDGEGKTTFSGKRQNQKILAAAGIYASYQKSLAGGSLYDYDDMILRAIAALEGSSEFKYSLAENYQYVLLDEFQDTNRAQMRLVELLTDHPVHEGRPNVMAVGDDDQAIYAFQGADHANMSYFANYYKDTRVISLEENYRSHTDIIHASQMIVQQIESRLHHSFSGVNKSLVAANKHLPKTAVISAAEFKSDTAQYEWVAEKIRELVDKQAVAPHDIAVLAPKHRHLLPLLPFLSAKKLPVRYDKRENILEAPIIRQLEQMSRLVLAIAGGNEPLASEIWPEVISYEFWELPTEKIWELSWETRRKRTPWTKALLEDAATRHIVHLFLNLKDLVPLLPLEEMLDALMGLPEISNKLKVPIKSPLFEYYFGPRGRSRTNDFTQLVSQLNKLRSGLRDWQHGHETALMLDDFVAYAEGHRAANINILDQSPYFESAEAVNLLTAYGAKGREFKAVFVVAASDDVWGSASRNLGSRLSLPGNISFIRYQGASEDERLRLLFVAVTRAKTHLYLTSYSQTLAGKKVSRLKYLNIVETEDGSLKSGVLPDQYAKIIQDESESVSPQAAMSYWTQRHLPPLTRSLKSILSPQLDRYQLSATHINRFTDIIDAGPDVLFLQSILGFKAAPTVTSVYGTAVHNTLRTLGGALNRGEKLPSKQQFIDSFIRYLDKSRLSINDYKIQSERGQASLSAWYDQSASDLHRSDQYEYDFIDEAVFVGKAHLSGKIDRLIVDEKAKTIAVVDYKTGQAYSRWENGVVKLHKFRQQLLVYKLLVENSTNFKGYQVTHGIVEFVEPNEHGKIVRLRLDYDEQQLQDIQQLILAIWRSVKNLVFPDTSRYPLTIAGIRAFEKDLIDNPRPKGI